MTSHDHEDRQPGTGVEDALWDAGGDSSLQDQVDPGFDNEEAHDVLSESFEDPLDVAAKEPGGQVAPKKKSNAGFYGAVGAFALVAVGLVGYKSGLIGGAGRKPIEPASLAGAMSNEVPKKAESIMAAAAPTGPAAADVFGSGAGAAPPAETKKAGSTFDAEADLLAERPAPPPVSVAAAPALVAAAAAAPAVPAPIDAIAPPSVTKVPEAPAAVPTVEKPAVMPEKVSVPERKAQEATASKPELAAGKRPVEAAATTETRIVKRSVKKHESTAAQGAVLAQAKRPKAVFVAQVPKPTVKVAKRAEKDATPEAREVMAGWKLRGTWPSHGPSQLAWIADESGRLMTVSVGERVSGAKVLSIGKHGEVVQTTAGQIVP